MGMSDEDTKVLEDSEELQDNVGNFGVAETETERTVKQFTPEEAFGYLARQHPENRGLLHFSKRESFGITYPALTNGSLAFTRRALASEKVKYDKAPEELGKLGFKSYDDMLRSYIASAKLDERYSGEGRGENVLRYEAIRNGIDLLENSLNNVGVLTINDMDTARLLDSGKNDRRQKFLLKSPHEVFNLRAKAR